MRALIVPRLSEQQKQELEERYRKAKSARLRTRAQIVLLSAEKQMKAPEISEIVREGQTTVQRWLKRYISEGIEGLEDAPRPGKPPTVTQTYREQLLASVRRRPRSLGLEFSLWTLQRLADYMAEQTAIRVSTETVRRELKGGGIVLSRPQHTISSPDPDYVVKKRRLKPHAIG